MAKIIKLRYYRKGMWAMEKHEKLHIRSNIRRLRFEHDEMTREALAEKAGGTRQTILAIESAKYSPSLELAFRIAPAFGAPIGDVFFCEQEEQEA